MTKTPPRLVAVVVTCNRLEKLKVTLARYLEAPPEVLAAIVLVNNASTDGTAGYLAGLADPRLEVLSLSENTGGAGGFEAGVRAAAQRFDPDWMVLSDDDARPHPGALRAFLDSRPDGRWDGAAAAVRMPGGEICGMNRPVMDPFRNGRAFLRTLRDGRAGFHLSDADYAPGAPERDIHGASFVGFFLSRAGLQRAGLPDGTLFLYADDALYTLGLTRAGGRIGFLPQIGFEHDFTSLTGPGAGRLQPLWRVYYYHRNLLFLYRLCAGWLFWPVLCLVLPMWLLKIRRYGGARRGFLRLMLAAMADGIRGRKTRPHAAVLQLAEDQRLSRST